MVSLSSLSQVIDLGEHVAGVAHADGRTLEQSAAGHHEQRGGNALVRNVGHGQTNSPVFQIYHVEEVAPHVTGRGHIAVDLEGVPFREAGGKDGLLHLAGDVQFVLQRHQLVPGLQGLLPLGHVLQGSLDGDLQILEIQGLGDEIEGPPVHGGADVAHIPVCRDDDRADVGVNLGNLLQQRQPVHLGHIDVRDHHVNVGVLLQHFQRLHPILGENEAVLPRSDFAPHSLENQRLEVGFVVNYQNFVGRLDSFLS